MAYKIDFDNPLDDEARRIARELIGEAADLLEKRPEGVHEAIHDARKNIKRIRALYRLIASEIEEFQAAENDRLRGIASALSHLRDSAVLAETTEYLERETDKQQAKTVIRRLGRAMRKRRDQVTAAGDELEATLALAAAGLREAADAADHLKLAKFRKQAIECIADGWRRTSKKALKALAACEHAKDEEPFHDLRKRTQDRFMHATLLHSVWPAGMYALQRQAKLLVDTLGREHDLAMLNEQVRGQRKDKNAADHRQLLQAIAAERRKLQAAARELAAQIFDDKPKRDAEIVALLIKNRS
jgi:CHAD domain-containing protein